jgi:hypothetical protein
MVPSAHTPEPSHWSPVEHGLLVSQALPAGSGAMQALALSSHPSAQFASPSAPGHGFPEWTLHVPAEQVSVPLQKIPSSQGLPSGSGPVHPPDTSLHDSAQLLSPSAPGHCVPACSVQKPFEQLSAPLHASPSSQLEPSGSGPAQLSADSLHDSEQLPSPSAPTHGLPVCELQAPAAQVSVPLQNRPSLHAEPFGSAAVHESAASSHDSEQLPSPSAPGHGVPECTLQVPPEQESEPLQKIPSSHGAESASAAVHACAFSSQDSEQLSSPSGPGHGLPV